MDLGLGNKVFLITGATSGIGQASATLLLDEGATVMMSARSSQADAEAWHKLRRTFGERCAYIGADLEDIDGPSRAVEATVRNFGRIDGAVVNGVPTPMGGLIDTSDKDLHGRLQGKAVACARLARAAVPEMRSKGGGVLIFVAGISAHSAGGQAYLSGTMATTAIHGLTKSLADEVAKDGIRVVTVDPGLTDTRRLRLEMLPRLISETRLDEQTILEELCQKIPLGRMADASDIADAIVFLASRRAKHITGTYLLVDGGASRSVR
jgi:NAD(P)-dependent dehydrogenase (short-subunit alcohol dehydrogenase family)